MMGTPLIMLAGMAAPLPVANVDTDMILAARFMKTLSRKGLGQHLFHSLRTDAAGVQTDGFVLDRAPWDQARFLVALENFGCGSSREHAPWSLLDFGIRCIIAPSFADIFSNNCTRNGIFPLVLPKAQVEALLGDAADPASARLHLDLPAQTLTRANGEALSYEVDPARKRRLIEGLDDITASLRFLPDIERHDARRTYPAPVVPLDAAAARVDLLRQVPRR